MRFPETAAREPQASLETVIPGLGHASLRRPRSDDELLAHLLIYTWMLITGRFLRSNVPPNELTEKELIDFWADDVEADD
jgi:hypothetical protein